jgi:hypothetical protein
MKLKRTLIGLLLATAASLAAAEPAELAFRDFYRLPVGPRGLEPGLRLLALEGREVRIQGWMATMSDAPPGLMVLAPVPVSLGDEDESFADDLPPATLYVHLPTEAVLAHRGGMLSLSGRLELGRRAEPDGRQSYVRLVPDEATVAALTARRP